MLKVRFPVVLLVGIALFGDAPVKPLSDREKVELFRAKNDLDRALKDINEQYQIMQLRANAAQVAYQKKEDEVKAAHGCPACTFTADFDIVPPSKGK